MRSIFHFLAVLPIVALLTTGCINAQQKLGRGIRNSVEPVRMGELRHSMEQTAVWDSPAEGATTGFVSGVCRTAARTGIGIYEVLTFPFPPYHPIATKYLSPNPSYPDNCGPVLASDPLYQANHYIGFQTGTTFGFVPGYQFDPLGQ